MTTEIAPPHFKQGDPVRITKGMYKGKVGEVQTVGHALDGKPLYLITVLLVYEQDQIERVTPEDRGVV